jgi:hypothetical protein
MIRRASIPFARGARLFAAVAAFGAAALLPGTAHAQLGGLIVTVTSPSPGATVSNTVTITASVNPLGALLGGVQFIVDGTDLGAEDMTSPYSIPWNTLGSANGTHTLRARARNLLGIQFTSNPVTVTVSNDALPPTVAISAPANGAVVTGTIAVTATASDNVGVTGVQFRLDGANLGAEDTSAPYSTSWNTSGAAPGNHTLSAVARDAAGNTTLSSSVTVSVGDATPPSVTLTAPAPGATVSGNVAVSASASDNVGVAGVQFRLDGANLGAEDTTAPYSVTWQTTTAANGAHTLTAVARDTDGNTTTSAAVSVTVSNAGFASGDVFVTIVDGVVQWRAADGTLRGTLTSPHDGQASSAAFDASGRLYVPHWWGRAPGAPGNVVVRFDGSGSFLGPFGSGYNSNPSSVTFDGAGNVYVGQADDSGDILKFDPSGALLAAFNVATFNRGTDHIDLGADGCTMFYTSRTQDVLRYDVCTNTQLTKLNPQPLPGEAAYHIRVLPDGGLLVADSHLIVRLDAAGNQVQSYFAAGESNYWGGVDAAGDGTFWATNAFNGNVYRFNLETGAVVSFFNTGTGNFTVAGVAVKP